MDRRQMGLALLAIGIVVSVLGTVGHDWLSSTSGELKIGVGLREVEVCTSGCREIALTETPVGSVVTMSGNVAYYGALIASALAAVAGALALARQSVTGQVSPARLAVAFYAASLVAGLIFLGSKPDAFESMSVGMGALLGLAGAALGAGGTLLMALEDQRPPRPLAPAAADLPIAVAVSRPQAAPEMTPGCPQCKAPLAWQPAHGRWSCGACNAYPRR